MNRRVAALLVAILLTSTACSAGAAPSGGGPGGIELAVAHVPRASVQPDEATTAGDAIQAFGLDLFRAAAPAGTNVVVSPASVAIALAMARAGAHGETAAQMDRVLRSLGADDRAAALNALDQVLASRSGSYTDANGDTQDVSLRIANAPFAQKDMPFTPGYLDALASRFGAGVRLVDYRRDAEGARRLINGWVADATEQRIRELIAAGVLDTATRLVLVNAIYLKAPWQWPFTVEATKDEPFTLLDGTRVSVPTMHLGASVPAAEGAGWKGVELPYVGGSLAMDVIVPDDLAAFESSLDASRLGEILGSLRSGQVILSLPKFSIETKAELSSALGRLGMIDAFDGGLADFSGITTAERLYIADVIHQANIDVDEKGTEAAAATAVAMAASAALQPITVRADRPFLFVLRDVPTGAVLFLGRVADPRTKA